MASLGAEEFYLIDHWPGAIHPYLSDPTAGFDSTTYNQVTTAAYKPGTKILGYNDTTTTTGGSRSANRGYYTVLYAKYLCATTAIDITAGDIVTISCGSAGAYGDLAVTRDMSASNGAGACMPAAIACADLTPTSYGFFWCGGICPQEDVTGLDMSAYVTDGSVTQGTMLVLSTGASHATFSIDVSDNATMQVGWAYCADA
jgi:hypothetical protein